MTRDDIIRLAREAGASTPRSIWPPTFQMSIDFSGAQLERFAALVAAAEREACLKIIQPYMDDSWIGDDAWNLARDVLNDIKARSTL